MKRFWKDFDDGAKYSELWCTLGRKDFKIATLYVFNRGYRFSLWSSLTGTRRNILWIPLKAKSYEDAKKKIELRSI